jgi:hypothetical protein
MNSNHIYTRVGKRYLTLACTTTLSVFLWVLATQPSLSQSGDPISTLDDPFKSKKLVIGVRTAASAIGNTVTTNSSGGFCGVFGEQLQEILKDQDISVSYAPVENNYLGKLWNRYDGLRNGSIHIECGPNSRPSGNPGWAEGIVFSETAFHKSGTRILIRKEIIDEFDKYPSLKDISNKITFSTVESTTVDETLKNYLDIKVSSLESIDKALDQLALNRDYVYASDALIVKKMLIEGVSEYKTETGKEVLRKGRQPYKLSGYTVFPKEDYLFGISEEYVMAMKDRGPDTAQLMNAVEQALDSPQVKEASKKIAEAEKINSIEPRKKSEKLEGTKLVNSNESKDGFPWVLTLFGVVFLGILSLLLLSKKLSSTNEARLRGEAEAEKGKGSVYIEINNSPTNTNHAASNSGTEINIPDSPFPKADFDANIVKEIRGMLEEIDRLGLPKTIAKSRAVIEGSEVHAGNGPLSERLLNAVEAGTMSALEKSIDHPLASFFIEGFKEFKQRE